MNKTLKIIILALVCLLFTSCAKILNETIGDPKPSKDKNLKNLTVYQITYTDNSGSYKDTYKKNVISNPDNETVYKVKVKNGKRDKSSTPIEVENYDDIWIRMNDSAYVSSDYQYAKERFFDTTGYAYCTDTSNLCTVADFIKISVTRESSTEYSIVFTKDHLPAKMYSLDYGYTYKISSSDYEMINKLSSFQKWYGTETNTSWKFTTSSVNSLWAKMKTGEYIRLTN